MTFISESVLRQAQDLSWQLGGCRSAAELESATLQWLFEHVPCSYAAYTDYPAYNAPTRVAIVPVDSDSGSVQRSVEEHFAEQPESDHPLVRHYFYAWKPVTPLRMSDLVSERQLRATRVYRQVFKPVGVTHQLAIVNRRVSLTDNAGYAVSRQGRDFSDDDVALAVLIQPVLYALHCCLSSTPPHTWEGTPHAARLTPSELDILRLLAAGMTAVAIGRARHTSPRTVGKHIEHVYAKLGMHDRLQVARYAEYSGLVRPDMHLRNPSATGPG